MKVYDSINFSKFNLLFKTCITGMPMSNTTNSPAAVVNHDSQNGNSNANFNSNAMIHIMNVKMKELISIRYTTFFTNLLTPINSVKQITECATPNTKSNQPSSENRLEIKTPNTTPNI